MNTHTDSIRTIKCRGIILNNDKILVVKHVLHYDFYTVPGGHLEGEENPKECVEREIIEELGVKPEVGRLLYVYQFSDPGKSFLEFFFEITNGADFENLDDSKIDRNEILDVVWVSKDNDINILPKKLNEDFKNGILGKIELQFIR
jgi:ADP-ribose pyrophosphatase YjhB (NUDIX family)